MIENVCQIRMVRLDERVEVNISTFSEYVQNLVFDKLDEAGFVYHIVGDVIMLTFSRSLICRFMSLVFELTWEVAVLIC